MNHYLFTSWPDHGVPEYATALIGFIRRVRARFNPEKAPLLVHCSAGVGRTGTFIVLDTMLERIKEQSSVNVYQTLQDIRLKRAKMVQTQVSVHAAYPHCIATIDWSITIVVNVQFQLHFDSAMLCLISTLFRAQIVHFLETQRGLLVLNQACLQSYL